MRKKELISLLSLLVILLGMSNVQGLDVTRQTPSEVPFNSTFEVTLSISSDLPLVVGINETIPDGFSFVNTSCSYNISGQKIAFAAINVTEIKYWVKAPAQAGVEGTFTGYWVDMLNESEGSIADTTVSVTPRKIVDSAGRNVTINKTVERIVVLNSDAAEAVKVLGCEDKVVGIVDTVQKKTFYFPEMSKKELVGTWKEVDWEAVINLTPDLVITYTKYGAKASEAEENLPAGIAVAGLDLYDPRKIPDEIQKLAVLLEREEKASQYLEWYNKYKTIVEELVEGKEKPKVFVTSTSAIGKTSEIPTYGSGTTVDEMINLAGGVNIYHNASKKFPKVTAEDVLTRNPDIIIIKEGYVYGWENEDEPQKIINDVLEGKGWSSVNAVKNHKVFVLPWTIVYGMEQPFGLTLFTKIFHPEINDINPEDASVNSPEDVYKEFLDFMGIEYPEGKIFWYQMKAPKKTPPPSGGGSYGGGGGGGSAPLPPPLKAPSEYHESMLEYLHANKEKIISPTSKIKEKTGVTEIGAQVSEDIMLRVTVSKVSSLPADVISPGEAYTYFEILFTKYGTQKEVEPSGYIKYRISKEWLENNNAEPSDVQFLKWNNSWVKLPSNLTGEDDEYYYFNVNVSSFSLFAVVLKTHVTPTATPTPTITVTQISQATPTATLTPKATTATPIQTQTPKEIQTITTPKPTPGFESAFAVIAVLASLLLLRRRW